MQAEVLDVIERIYAAGSERARWNDLLEAIPDLAGAEAANMLVARPKTGTMTVLSPRTDAAFVEAFFSDWWSHDPTYARTLTAPVGQVVTLADTGRETFLKSRFHNEFWKTSGHGAERMRANLIINGDIQIGFGLMPAARNDAITPEMQRLYLAILPHLIRAVDLQWRIHRLEMKHAVAMASGQAAGVVVVNSDGRILLADATAEDILANGTPLAVKNGVLQACEARDTDNLHRLIMTCLPCGNGFSLRGGAAEIRSADRAALTLTVLPVPARRGGFGLDIDTNADPAAIIVVEDAAARRAGQADRLRAQFGLTAKEATVALECLAGGTRAHLAARLKVSDSTVRTHLTRIYEKTRTSRKAELIGLLYRDGICD